MANPQNKKSTLSRLPLPPVVSAESWKGHEVKELTFAQKCSCFSRFGGLFECSVASGAITSTELIMQLAADWEKFLPLSVPTYNDWESLSEKELIEAVIVAERVNKVSDFILSFFYQIHPLLTM